MIFLIVLESRAYPSLILMVALIDRRNRVEDVGPGEAQLAGSAG